jgi:hypothetical protein
MCHDPRSASCFGHYTQGGRKIVRDFWELFLSSIVMVMGQRDWGELSVEPILFAALMLMGHQEHPLKNGCS